MNDTYRDTLENQLQKNDSALLDTSYRDYHFLRFVDGRIASINYIRSDGFDNLVDVRQQTPPPPL